MKRVLLVEDDDGKRDALVDQISSTIPNAQILECNSLISAIRELKKNDFDIIILDVTLPYRDISPARPPGDMHKLGGEEVLRHMERYQTLTPVIVVSQFDTFGDDLNAKKFSQLITDFSNNFPNQFKAGVYYHASMSDWNDELDRAIRQNLEF